MPLGRVPPHTARAPRPSASSTSAATLSRVSALTKRPDRDPVIEPIAHLERAHLGGELRDEGVVHLLVDVKAVGRGAGLAHVAHLGDHRALDRGVKIGVLEHQERRVAAQLHRRPHHVVGRLVQEPPPHLGRAGERDDAHVRVLQHGAHHRARFARRQDVDDARRHARLGQKLGDRQHGERGLRGGLQAPWCSRRPAPARSCACPSRPGNSTASPAPRRRRACAAPGCARPSRARATPGRYCAAPLRRTSGRTPPHRPPRRANPPAPCRSRASSGGRNIPSWR